MFGIRADQHLLRIDRSTKRWLIILLTIVLSLGVFFRIANLGVKPIWLGEAYTRSVISGYSESEALDKIPTGEIVNVEGFLKYQYPNSEKTIGDTFRKLYTDNHALLYFLLAHYWVKLFGHSVTVLRSMSAVLSILAVSCIYWFCMELFELPLVGWMASALLSVSPIQVIYAQDAGSSSLLSLVILLSGASLLWSLRTQKKAWFTYAISLVLGIYSEYFFILVILGYLAYVFSIESFRFTQKFQCFLLVTFASLLAFLPWFTIILFHLSDSQAASAWMSQHNLMLLGGISLWVENTSLSFIDLVDPKASEYNGLRKFDFYFLTPPILILVGYSIYLLRLRMSKRVYLFVISLIGSTALPLITIDWVFGGNRQIWSIYLFPCLLGIQTSVAYLLSSKILYSDFSRESWQRRSWSLITATLVTVGVIFCLTILQANTWWNKYGGEYTLSFTQIIHQPKNSLVLVNRQRPETIIFYNLEPEVKLLLITDETLKAYCFKGDDDVFFLNPSKNMQAELKLQHYGLEALAQFSDPDKVYDEPPQLWKLRRGNN